MEPTSAPFWKAVSEVLSTAVRLDPPKAMDPMDEPEAEIEWLFEAVVQPTQPQERRVRRIDRQSMTPSVSCLIPSRPRVSAFGGTKEQVRRGVETERGVLLVDGVNLAAATARKEADAFVSRFMRISDAYGNRPVHIIVGYASSPDGLNGEAHMRDWIREKLTDQVFDVIAQKAEFKKAAADAWSELRADPQTVLRQVAGTEE